MGKLKMKFYRLNENKLDETTDSGSIAYLPDGYTDMKSTIASLGGLKSKWKVEILEQEDNYDVSFEDKLKVIIPKIHYKHFNDNVLKIDGLKEVSLKEMLREAIKVDFKDLTSTLTTTLRKIPSIQNSLELMNAWLSIFSNSEYQPMFGKTLINLQKYDESVSNLLKGLSKHYGEDKGYIEELVSTIEEGRPLNTIDYINNYDYLVGCRIKSKYEEESFTLSLLVNLALQPTQVIIVDSEDVAEEAKFYKEVKVIKNQIYPVGGTFKPYFFSSLKDILYSLGD